MSNALLARGNLNISDVFKNIDRIKKGVEFVRWNDDGFKIGLCKYPPLGSKYSCLSLTNNTAIKTPLGKLKMRFNKLYKRKAHLHH